MVLLVGFCLMFATLVVGEYAAWEKRVPYCQKLSSRCSLYRNDLNFVVYYDSKCYCDWFCRRSKDSFDCCPDFEIACKPSAVTEPSPSFSRAGSGCMTGGHVQESGKSFYINRIQCECSANKEWSCSGTQINDDINVNDELIKAINAVNFVNTDDPKWKTAIYKQWLNGSIGKIRTSVFGDERSSGSRKIVHSLPYYEHDPGLFYFLPPLTYDLRNRSWPVGQIRNQRRCPISYIISAIDVAADRFARQSNIEIVWNRTISPLSIQFPLSCGSSRQCSSHPNDHSSVWKFLNKFGAVKERCYPYTSGMNGIVNQCKFPYDRRTQLSLGGQNMMVNCGKSQIADIVFKFGNAYRLFPRVKDIQYELFLRGPVQATLLACPDFMFYKQGIYEQLIQFERHQCNYHSVRLLGWSQDKSGRIYWICANSWGKKWGEHGYFRIYTGQCEIEQHVVTTWGHGEAYYAVNDNGGADFAK